MNTASDIKSYVHVSVTAGCLVYKNIALLLSWVPFKDNSSSQNIALIDGVAVRILDMRHLMATHSNVLVFNVEETAIPFRMVLDCPSMEAQGPVFVPISGDSGIHWTGTQRLSSSQFYYRLLGHFPILSESLPFLKIIGSF